LIERKEIRRQIDRDLLISYEELLRKKCPACDDIKEASKERWKSHNEQELERQLACRGAIEGIKKDFHDERTRVDIMIDKLRDAIIGKFWFRVIVGFLFAAIIGLGIQQNWAFKEILENQRGFTSTLNNVENRQIETNAKIAVFEKEIESLNKRQDVLRDAHMKIIQEKK
jgi:hypothetical protein